MEITLTNPTPETALIKVEVNESDYADKVKKELKKIAREGSFPGFRKGHVPFGQVEKKFGRQVMSDVLNQEVFEKVIEYIRNNKLQVLGEPMPVALHEVKPDVKDYTFEYEIGLAPALDVEVDKDIKLPFYRIEVSDAMVDEQDKQFRERFGAQVPGEEVDAKALVKGVLQQLNEDGTVNTNEGAIEVEDGIVAPFLFANKEEADKFLGKKLNDKVVFNPYNSCNGSAVELSSMLHIDKAIAGDIKNDFQMTISEIIVLKPAELNQELFDNVAGKDRVHNEEEYREFIKKMIEQQLSVNSRQYFDYEVQKFYDGKYADMALPVEFLKKWLVARNEELTADNIDTEFEQMLPSLKWQLISEAIATKLGVKIEESDIMEFAKALARQQFMQYGMTNVDEETVTSTAQRILNDEKYRRQIVDQVSNQKLFQAIYDAITVEPREVSLDKFKEIAGAK